ncbi:hypothetical protein M0R45_035977 [Rubus argutus]|uniref:CCHC-type domain-containing protein n=1 Tax=Rubus argutus TaxID=59490 RepID=A0AAW1VYF6_RUBAR
MKIEMVTKIPDSFVKKRWTKDASVKKPSVDVVESGDVSLQIAQYGELMSICSETCHTTSYTDALYEQAKEALSNLNLQTQQQRRHINSDKEHLLKDGLHQNDIRDPVVCRTKGSRSKQGKNNCTENENPEGAKCTMCGNPGHNRRTCFLSNSPTSNMPASAPNFRPHPDSYFDITTSSMEDLSPTPSRNNTDCSKSGTEDEASTHNDPTHLFHHRKRRMAI